MQSISTPISTQDEKNHQAEEYYNLGNLERSLGKEKNAAENYIKAIQLNPLHTHALNNLGGLYLTKKLFTEASALFEQALTIDHNNAHLHNNLGSLFRDLGQIDRAIDEFKKAITIDPNFHLAWSNFLFTLNYSPDYSSEEIFLEHQKWGKLFPTPQTPKVKKTDRIKIGYISPDFKTHSVAYFFEPILKNHDQDRFEIHLYSDVEHPDQTTLRLQKLTPYWHTIYGKSDDVVFSQIQSDGIQILIDLTGHTSGNRLPLFAKKPAPLQITYLGYPNTTGLTTMDYRICDEITDPSSSEKFHTESLLRLPNFLTYLPTQDVEPKSSKSSIRFGCFNAMPKMNEPLFKLWASILRFVPHSTLLLKNTALHDTQTVIRLKNFFEKNGIGSERILTHTWIDASQNPLKLYEEMDIALDTFPYHGTTTTCEALWMGVPVITLSGNRHASRVGLSLLKNIGFEAGISNSQDDYIKKAVALASNPQELINIKKNLRKNMINSPLMRADLLTKNLEQIYQNIWGERC